MNTKWKTTRVVATMFEEIVKNLTRSLLPPSSFTLRLRALPLLGSELLTRSILFPHMSAVVLSTSTALGSWKDGLLIGEKNVMIPRQEISFYSLDSFIPFYDDRNPGCHVRLACGLLTTTQGECEGHYHIWKEHCLFRCQARISACDCCALG